ncbi:hypothetical protein CHARACLAT_032365 [Characodon lateralis]|uniref:Uncharacterized protein n=1 Tax=Characodon lateralis TaxID=208331 RepID=A0ABU7EP92_9TELE|nr:hypothetical protein [Characodon lateralis]
MGHPPKSVIVMYAQGVVALCPYLEDPFSKHGYEHYYDPESGSGYPAWRLKTIQRETAEEKVPQLASLPKVAGQAMVNPGLSLLTKCCLMRKWKLLSPF